MAVGKKMVGFALLYFDHGAIGNTTYVSNADRADMIKALHELIAVLQGNMDQPPVASGKQE